MGLQDLERQVVRFTHPAHLFASAAAVALPPAAGACIVAAVVVGGLSLPLETLGPQPRIVNCHRDATPCLDTLPEWLRKARYDEALVDERAYQRIRGELETDMARIRGASRSEWAARAQELEVGQPRSTKDWTEAEGQLQTLPEDWPTLRRRSTLRSQWSQWAEKRAAQLARSEADAYRTAWETGRDHHFDRVYAQTQQAHDDWTSRRTRWILAGFAALLGALGGVLGLVALGAFVLRLRWASFTVVVTRHALVGGEGDDERTVLAGLSDLELQGVVDTLQRFGHTPTCGTGDLTEALLLRRDAADQGALPPATHQQALSTMLNRRRG